MNPTPPPEVQFWNERYAQPDYVFGTAPNAFLAAATPDIPAGPVLCLAEGEGRNAVFLATRGHPVTAVDQSVTGLAKTEALARTHRVHVTTTQADLADYTIAPGAWSGIVAIFMHLLPELRRAVLARVAAGLKPGGIFVMEAYTPAQLGRGTGGPRDAALLPTLAELRTELPGLVFAIGRELERHVVEGTGHTGNASVVQVIARRPR